MDVFVFAVGSLGTVAFERKRFAYRCLRADTHMRIRTIDAVALASLEMRAVRHDLWYRAVRQEAQVRRFGTFVLQVSWTYGSVRSVMFEWTLFPILAFA